MTKKIIFLISLLANFSFISAQLTFVDVKNTTGNETKRFFNRAEIEKDLDIIHSNTKAVYTFYNKTIDSCIRIKKKEILSSIKDSISSLEYYYRLQEMMSCLKDYHVGVRGILRYNSGWLKYSDKVFPLILNFNNKHAFLKNDFFGHNITPKSEILEINNVSISEILKTAQKLSDYCVNAEVSINNCFGSAQDVDDFSNLLRYLKIEYPYEVKYRDCKTGYVTTSSLQSVTRNSLHQKMRKFQNGNFGNKNVLEFTELNKNTALLKINTFLERKVIFWVAGVPSLSMKKLNRYINKIKRKNYENLIIDLRGNNGGTMSPVYTILDNLISGNYFVNDYEYNPSLFKIDSTRFSRDFTNITSLAYNISKEESKKNAVQFINKAKTCTQTERLQTSYVLGNKKRNNKVKTQFKGNVYFLIDNYCSSATIMFLDIAKYYNVGLIIGEPTAHNISVTTCEQTVYNRTGIDIRVRGANTIPLNKSDNPFTPLTPHIYHKDSLISFTESLIEKGVTINNYKSISKL